MEHIYQNVIHNLKHFEPFGLFCIPEPMENLLVRNFYSMCIFRLLLVYCVI